MPRLAPLLVVLLLALAPASALAQQDTPFGPVPEPAPTVEPAPGTDDVGRTTLYLIAAGVLVVVVGIGYAISRDARRSLPADEREALEREREGRQARGGGGAAEEMPGQVSREARARARKQRSKAKIARESRKKNRPRR